MYKVHLEIGLLLPFRYRYRKISTEHRALRHTTKDLPRRPCTFNTDSLYLTLLQQKTTTWKRNKSF